MVCERVTDWALGPSMFGVHSGGSVSGSLNVVNSWYIVFSFSAVPLPGNKSDIASKIFSCGTDSTASDGSDACKLTASLLSSGLRSPSG